MYLGIEIGGTKLQLGVGAGNGEPLVALERLDVRPQEGAEGIRRQIRQHAEPLVEQYGISSAGVGFGGPVDAVAGRTILSHQVDGWEDFPLAQWLQRELAVSAVLGNDSDLAGLGEARFGAGRGHRVVFYTNIGSGIGGALVVAGELHRGGRGVASELGHLRPGLHCDDPDQTVESIASGWGIAAAVQARLADPSSLQLQGLIDGTPPSLPEEVRQRLIDREEADERFAADLLERCNGHVERLSAALVAQAASDGNRLARDVFDHACRVFGWAVAQMITLLAPDVVVLGGGVSLVDEDLLLLPARNYVDQYVFPPLQETFEIIPAQLGEEVVVHGALALASASG